MSTLQTTRYRIAADSRTQTPHATRQTRELAETSSLYRRVFEYNLCNRDRWVAGQAQQIATGARVLDVGAGRGRYRPLFAHCDYRTQDFAQEPGTVGHYTPLDYESDIVEIPVKDASFDAVLCTEVLEHVPDPIRAVNEMARILRPGGTMLLSAPLGSTLHQEPYHFYGGYTPYWYRKVLNEAGLEIVSLERNEGFFRQFAQEGQRFCSFIDPRHLGKRPWLLAPLGLLWLVTLPVFRLVLPLLAIVLDRLDLERISTVGYHVVARKA